MLTWGYAACDQDDAQQVVGATIEDQQTGRKTDVHARIVINATGPFADSVRSGGSWVSAPWYVTLPLPKCCAPLLSWRPSFLHIAPAHASVESAGVPLD